MKRCWKHSVSSNHGSAFSQVLIILLGCIARVFVSLPF